MKRSVYITFIFMLTALSLVVSCGKIEDDPRASVGLVRTPLNKEMQNSLLALVSDDTVDSELKKTFVALSTAERNGSGFLVSGHDHENGSLFVTNKHVIKNGDHPQITFDDGKTFSVSDILYEDPSRDLAVLMFKKSNVEQHGLKLEPAYTNSDIVSSLGYPAAKEKGTFQITKGTISDQCIKGRDLPDLEDAEDKDGCWIKHTAEIDKGSSGGPLVKTSTVTMRGKQSTVIGVNTAYLPDKNSVFLAIPSEAVTESLQQAEEVLKNRSDESWRRIKLRETCQRFIAELTSSKLNASFLVSTLSNGLLAENGFPLAKFNMQHMGYLEERLFMEALRIQPLDIYRGTVITDIVILLRSNGGIATDERCEHLNANDGIMKTDGTVRIRIGLKYNETVELVWIFENNAWRLRDYSLL